MIKGLEQKAAEAMATAMDAGWEPVPGAEVKAVNITLQDSTASYIDFQVVRTKDKKRLALVLGLNDVIFDHSFAKAYWGQKLMTVDKFIVKGKPHRVRRVAFKYHLSELSQFSVMKGRINYIATTKPQPKKEESSETDKN